jgi:ribosome-associated heat shock protein Hsp15
MRVDGERIAKASFALRPGATLTFPQARRIRVVRVLSLASRRGPAPEAQTLYTDLTPKEELVPRNPRFEGKGRPGKKDRRNARLLDRRPLD